MHKVFFVFGFLGVLSLMPVVGLAESDAPATTTASGTTPAVTTPTPPPPARPTSGPRGLSVAAQTRLTNLAANVSNRLDAYVRRITNVTDRLDSRANKMAESGLAVDAARAKIAEARTELEKARASLTNIDAAVNNFVRSENPRTYWQSVKTTYLAATDAIKAAHRATVEALLLLKTATATQSPTATSTTTSSNDVE